VEDLSGNVPQSAKSTGQSAERHALAAYRALDAVECALRAEAAALSKRHAALRKNLDAFMAPLQKSLATKYSRFFLEQRERVLNRMSSRSAASARSDQSEDLLATVFPRSVEDAFLAARIQPVLVEAFGASWNHLNAETGIPENVNPFSVEDPRIMQALEKRKIQGAMVNSTTEEDLRQLFAKAIDEGLTTAEIGDRIAEYYHGNIGADSARPQTAANTQMTGLVNDGRMAAAQSAGGLVKGWLHGGSEHPRPDHLAAQAKYLNSPIPLNEPFTIPGSGAQCQAPGDADLPIGEVANCTCMAVFTAAKPEAA
jgi:hypothetical protein